MDEARRMGDGGRGRHEGQEIYDKERSGWRNEEKLNREQELKNKGGAEDDGALLVCAGKGNSSHFVHC